MTEPLVLSADPPAGTRLLVTGGARGIGRAVADGYAARGAKVCILDRDPVSDAPADWICVQGSVTLAAEVERRVKQRFGRRPPPALQVQAAQLKDLLKGHPNQPS